MTVWSKLKTPAASALLSSEALNVVTPAAHSVGAQESECESGASNESERDGEHDDDSDDDLEIVGEESGTADSTGVSSAGTETPAKKAKITPTALLSAWSWPFWPALCFQRDLGLFGQRKLPCGFMRETYSDIHLENIKVSLIIVKKLSPKVSPIAVNVVTYHFHLLQYMESPYLHFPNDL